MCIYDTTHFACTAQLLHLVERCPWPEYCLPHIRHTLRRASTCHLCAVAGLEEGSHVVGVGGEMMDGPYSDRHEFVIAGSGMRYEPFTDVQGQGDPQENAEGVYDSSRQSCIQERFIPALDRAQSPLAQLAEIYRTETNISGLPLYRIAQLRDELASAQQLEDKDNELNPTSSIAEQPHRTYGRSSSDERRRPLLQLFKKQKPQKYPLDKDAVGESEYHTDRSNYSNARHTGTDNDLITVIRDYSDRTAYGRRGRRTRCAARAIAYTI